MRIRYFGVLAPIVAAGLLAGAAQAAGHLYGTEDQARQACASDTVVWVDVNRNKYYHVGSAKYGRGDGGFTCEKATHALGYQAAKDE
jgi:hypothetical protein